MKNPKYTVLNVRQKQKSLIGQVRNFFSKMFENPFDSASRGRRTRHWNAIPTGPNSALLYGFETIRARSRDLSNKFPLLHGAYDTIVSNIVGTGIQVIPQISDKYTRDKIRSAWDVWCENCDNEGVNDLTGILQQIVHERYEAGEAFIRMVNVKKLDNNIVPFKLQVIESEQVVSDKNEIADNGNTIIGGIEYNKKSQRVAIWIYKNHPNENIVGSTDIFSQVRIPIEDIIHYFKPLRAGQSRGLPECFSAHLTAKNLMDYDDAELEKKKTASMIVASIETPLGENTLLEDDDVLDTDNIGPGEALGQLSPGMILTMAEGESFKLHSPAESGVTYEPFRISKLRDIAAALNMTYEEFSLDLSKVNFSSIRTGLNQSQKKYRKEQRRLGFMVLKRIYNRFIQEAIISGILDIPGYFDDRIMYSSVQFQYPGWAYVNPHQEVLAQKEQVKCGFKSRSQVVSEMGGDVEEVDEQNKIDQERMKAAGLKYDTSEDALEDNLNFPEQ